MPENNEREIVREAQKIINDYVNTLEMVYKRDKRRKKIGFLIAFITFFVFAAVLIFCKI